MKGYLSLLVLFVLFLSGCKLGYVKEADGIYYNTWNEGNGRHSYKLMADRKTFKVLKNSYAKDKDSVYYGGGTIVGADPATFKSLGSFYASDKNSGYYGSDKIEESVGTSFRLLKDGYATDGHYIFTRTDKIEVCSIKNFRFVFKKKEEDLERRWTTDGCHYFYMKYKLPSEDYADMVIYPNSGGLAKDKKWVYFMDHKLNYDIDGRKVVDTIDAASFEVLSFIVCRDKYSCFNVYHGRENCEDDYQYKAWEYWQNKKKKKKQ